MDDSLIYDLQAEFGQVVSWHSVSNGITKEGWFLLEITPFPEKGELNKIVADIENGRTVGVTGGQLTHLSECDEKHHVIKSGIVQKALKDLSEKTFKVAVYAGNTSLKELDSQPIAIVLEPKISYFLFPDHPHLNAGAFDKINGFYFPNSLCYTDNPAELGDSLKDRLLEAFSQISIWLFRHQIWEATRKYKKMGEWIGPQADRAEDYVYPLLLNPNGVCRCRSGKKYSICHRLSDVNAFLTKFQTAQPMVTKEKPNLLGWITIERWEREVNQPSVHSIEKLKELLLI